MKICLNRHGSTEYALFACFDNYFHSKLPLDDDGYLRDIQKPISFIYGDKDWMKNVGTHDCLAKNPYKGTHSHYYTLENSDHHLYLDNPEGMVELVLHDLANLDELDSTKPPEAYRPNEGLLIMPAAI